MIYTILSKLFKYDEYSGDYKAKPAHIFLAIFIMSVGFSSMLYQSGVIFWFGLCVFILGFLLGLSILFVMNWSKVIEYWTVINEHVILMNKSNPDIWVALGYSKPVQKVEVVEREDTGQGLYNTRVSNVLISPSKMNQVANKVLGSGKLEFTEEEYGRLIPNFRQFRKDWIAQGKLVQKNKKNKKLGYVLSRKGLQTMYEFSSDNMKLKENGEQKVYQVQAMLSCTDMNVFTARNIALLPQKGQVVKCKVCEKKVKILLVGKPYQVKEKDQSK